MRFSRSNKSRKKSWAMPQTPFTSVLLRDEHYFVLITSTHYERAIKCTMRKKNVRQFESPSRLAQDLYVYRIICTGPQLGRFHWVAPTSPLLFPDSAPPPEGFSPSQVPPKILANFNSTMTAHTEVITTKNKWLCNSCFGSLTVTYENISTTSSRQQS